MVHSKILQPKESSVIAADEAVLGEAIECDTSTDGHSDEVEKSPVAMEVIGKTSSEPLAEPPYSIFTNRQKVSITLLVSFLALISPLSGQIYLPALDPISESLNVSINLINLTITTFMV